MKSTSAARWEWRTFERELPVDPTVLDASLVEDTQVTEETYLLGGEPGICAKVSHERIEISRLEPPDASGLEQWRQVLWAPLPIDHATAQKVGAVLGSSAPARALDHYDKSALLHYLTHDHHVHQVRLIAQRCRLVLHGCEGEYVVLHLRNQRWESLAFSHDRPEAVLAAVTALGFDPRSNTSYPTGLRRILSLGTGPMPSRAQGVA